MKKEIAEDDEIKTGDILEIHYKMKLAFIATEWRKKKFLDKLREDSRYKILKTIWDDTKKKFVIKVLIVQNPFPLVLLLGAMIACGGGAALYLTTDKIYKIISTPLGALIPLAILVFSFGYYKLRSGKV